MDLPFYLVGAVLTLAAGASGAVPDGYTIKVQSDCGSSYTDIANITVLTDLPAKATAVCANGDYVMNITGNAFHRIVAYYNTGGDGCQFFKRAKSRIYLIYLLVTVNDVQHTQEQYTVTCAFGNPGAGNSSFQPIEDSYLAPLELQINNGPISESEITMYFTNLMGVVYPTNSNIPIMTAVQLVAESNGAGGEGGIQVSSCDAVGVKPGGMRYPMLRAGCGDGLIMAKDVGFITTGLKAVSYAFNMFHVAKDPVLKIICNVTLCNSTCDGSSCANERKRRDTDLTEPGQHSDMTLRLYESKAVIFKVLNPDDFIWTRTDMDIMITIVACMILIIFDLILIKCLFL